MAAKSWMDIQIPPWGLFWSKEKKEQYRREKWAEKEEEEDRAFQIKMKRLEIEEAAYNAGFHPDAPPPGLGPGDAIDDALSIFEFAFGQKKKDGTEQGGKANLFSDFFKNITGGVGQSLDKVKSVLIIIALVVGAVIIFKLVKKRR